MPELPKPVFTLSGLDVLYMLVAGLVVCGLLWFIHRTFSSRAKKWLIIAVTFIGGLFYLFEYFLPAGAYLPRGLQSLLLPRPRGGNFLSAYVEPVSDAVSVIGAFTIGLGVLNLSLVHGRNIVRRRPGWHNSLAYFIAFFAMVTFGLLSYYWPDPNPADRRVPPQQQGFEILFNGLYQPLSAAMFSVLAFYIASAAYRAFRIRSGEATLMMIAAFIVMLGQVPLGMWLTSGLPTDGMFAKLRLEVFSQWLLAWISMTAYRAVLLGVAVGALAMSLRVWLSLERGAFFEMET